MAAADGRHASQAVGDDIGAAWKLFGDVRAPAPVENGFVRDHRRRDLG